MEPNEPVRRITTQDASGKTVTIEVKTITLSAKSLTLSIFRQLQKEELIDYDSGELNGVPWGWVNYNPGDCHPAGDLGHLHVVWQKDHELRRDCVSEEYSIPFGLLTESDSSTRRWLAQAALEGEITQRNLTAYQRSLMDSDSELRAALHPYLLAQSALANCLSRKPESLASDPLGQFENSVKKHEESIVKYRENVRAYATAYPYEHGSRERVQQSIAEFKNNWRESYAAIASTKQLFIGAR